MRLICPSCSVAYRIDSNRWPHQPGADGLPVPRPARARCKACDHVWLALPDAGAPPILLDDPLPPATGRDARLLDDADAGDARSRWRGRAALAGASLALAAAGLWFAALMQQWRPQDYGLPPAAIPSLAATRAALADLGLVLPPMPRIALPAVRLPEPEAPALGVSAEAVHRQVPGGGHVWEVRGEVRNPGTVTLPVPPLEIILLSADGRAVGRWTVRADVEQLPPGGAAPFQTSAINPPEEARRLSVRLRPPAIARL